VGTQTLSHLKQWKFAWKIGLYIYIYI
jgi:hypothetical protein